MHYMTARIIAAVIAVGVATPVAGSARAVVAVIADTKQNTLPHVATDSADAAAVVTAFHRALAIGDSAAAMALLAPDAIIQESGSVETRSDYAGHHLPGDIRFAQALPGVRSPQRVSIVGDVAWSTSTSATKGRYRDREINSVGAELMVLSRASGTWRIRAIHWSSRTPKA